MATSARLSYFGFTKQVSFNTPLAPTLFPRWLDGSSLVPDLKTAEINEGDGSRDFSLVFKEAQMWKGKIVFYPRPQEMGWIAQMTMGAASDTITGAGSPYTHTFAPKAVPSYYTFEWAINEATLVAGGFAPIYRVQDCVITQLTIEGESNKPVKATVEFVGRKAVRQSAAATVALETGLPFMFTNGIFQIDDGTGALTDQSTDTAKFKLTFANNVDDSIFTNSIVPADLPWTYRKIMIDFETIFQNDTKIRQMFFGSNTGTTDAVALGTGKIDFKMFQNGDAAGFYAQFKLNNIAYEGKPVEPKLDGKALRLEVSALALTPAAGNIIDIVVTNGKSTAY